MRVIGLYETHRRNESEGRFGRQEVGSLPSGERAPPARLIPGAVPGGGARAYTLGPERW